MKKKDIQVTYHQKKGGKDKTDPKDNKQNQTQGGSQHNRKGSPIKKIMLIFYIQNQIVPKYIKTKNVRPTASV